MLHGTPDVRAVIEALADRLRLLLRTRLVCVLLTPQGAFELRAVSAETPQLANSARARHDRPDPALCRGPGATRGHRGRADHALHRRRSAFPGQPGLARDADCGAAPHFAHPGRDSGLSAAGRRFHRGRKGAGLGDCRFRSRGRGACGTLCHGSCAGARTASVAGDFFRTQFQQRSGAFSAGFRGARRGFPRLRTLLHRVAGGRSVPGSLRGGKRRTEAGRQSVSRRYRHQGPARQGSFLDRRG